ncbi:MAG: tetratricopeptide repeat protein [Spirochaetes bacterium]|nr:tetratricopeptide repeat protein [Spirochaetota bacterium]
MRYIPFASLPLLIALLISCAVRQECDASFSRGLEAYERRDFANAEYQFAAALKADGGHLPSRLMRGKSFFFQKRFAEAAAEFSAAAKKDSMTGRLWLARTHLVTGEPLKGDEAALRRVVLGDDENVAAWFLLGQIAEARGDWPKAADAYGRGLVYEKEAQQIRLRLEQVRGKLGLAQRKGASK